MEKISYEVSQSKYCSTYSWVVLAPVGYLNRCKGRYATKAEAHRRARYLTNKNNHS
ncbi:hypothetical protein [Caulobacter phage Cr30]|uniref:hypothetical protein n=1 Tax=Caulobacter phage Cr30 TaxID=1357714 RepID=UPI0004A9B4AC|nr:hypothetical protein OZ74_gp165 [Caulobacter phage Cr30]AGS81050.1 hypothetical protein [Caulobacter phage Cr30]